MTVPITGAAFPFQIDPHSGRVAIKAGSEKLKDNLRHLLLTRVGERLMIREYGSGATQLLHENIDDSLVSLARHQLTKSILRFEPRVLLQNVAVISQNGDLYLHITYIEANNPAAQALILPLQPSMPYP